MKKFFSLFAAVLFAGSMMAGQFVRVTDMANLAPGDQIIIVSESEDYAMGAQNSNNRAGVAVTVAEGVIEAGADVQVITLEAAEQNLKLKVGEDAYLYAASNSSNHLKTATAETAGDNGVWAISTSGDTVTLTAQGTNARNVLRFNPNNGNPVFSCYAASSSVKALVKIFKADGEVVPPTPVDTFTVAGKPASVFGEEWNPALAANDMVKVDTLYKWEKAKLELAAGDVEFKVVKNHSWDIAYPASNYVLNIAEAGEYTITILFDPATETVAAQAVKKEALPDPTTCAQAAEAALSVSKNNELYNDGKEYTIEGFVTKIETAWSEQYKNITFWMADTKDGGEVLEAFRAVCETEADAPVVGDKVAVTGALTKYNTTPEFAAKCTFVIIKDEPVSDWTEIAFDHAVLADSLPADAVFEFDGLKVAITDTDNKMAIDANDARFGTAEAYNMLNYRLKTGGKSSSKNLITVSVPADGKLRLAVRTGSNSATNRNLVIAQGTDTLYNQIILESQAVEAVEGVDTVKVYPYVEVEVKKGDIVLTYPVGSLNFYAFAFQSNQAPETTWTVAGSSAAVFGTAWDPKNTTNDMFKVEEGQYNWSKSGLELAAGEIEFKVVKDHAWTEAYPAQNYKLTLDSAGIYTITISFDEAKKEVSALAIKTGEAVVLPKVEIKGSWKDGKYDSSWNGGAAYEFTVAEDKKTASYILKLDEVHEYEFGFQFDGSWKANGAVITREANTTNLAEGSGNMKLNVDQAGKYEFVYTFETQALVVNYPKPIQTYEVAEAIAAGLAENDEINVRGIITKMEFKGKNFAKYGSVNIYVKDATGAEGEFEFYNCYSLNADTFRTSTPAYDPESTAWAEFAEVADANGNAIHVGDTVIAFGKYKLYNTTYELNTGCYLIDIKHGTPAEADTIKLELNNGMVLNMYYELYGSSDVLFTNIPVDEAGELVGNGDYLDLSIFPEDPNNVAGLYSSAEEYDNFDLDYSYLLRINGTDTLEYEFVEAVAAIVIGQTSREQGIAELAIEAKLATAEGLVFELAYKGLVAYDFIDEQGLEEIMTETNGKVLKIMHEGQVFILKDNKLYNLTGQSVR